MHKQGDWKERVPVVLDAVVIGKEARDISFRDAVLVRELREKLAVEEAAVQPWRRKIGKTRESVKEPRP
jgi:hypothetical protein